MFRGREAVEKGRVLFNHGEHRGHGEEKGPAKLWRRSRWRYYLCVDGLEGGFWIVEGHGLEIAAEDFEGEEFAIDFAAGADAEAAKDRDGRAPAVDGMEE